MTQTEIAIYGFNRGARSALTGLLRQIDEMDKFVSPETVFPDGPCAGVPVHAVHARVREYINLALTAVPTPS